MAGALAEKTPASRRPGADELVVERCGPHALIRCRHEAGGERPLAAALPRGSGHLAVLVSVAAHWHPALEDTVYAVLRSILSEGSGAHTVWLTLAGLGADRGAWAPLVHRILGEFKVDVVAPDGPFAGTPGTGTYVGPSIGAVGWRRFHTGSPSTVLTTRFPVPVWERTLPQERLGQAGVVAEPVLAGLLVRGEPAEPLTPAHPVFRIPADPARPKVLVESDRILPGQVAGLLQTIEPAVRAALLLVPLSASAAGLGWMSQLAERCAHGIVFSTGIQVADVTGVQSTVVIGAGGEPLFRPFPTVLRQRPGTLEQEVLDIAAPPAGWQRYSASGYRMAGDGPVVDVVPAGLVLREPSTDTSANREPFDPHGWTLSVGVPAVAVTGELLTAFERLLAGLGADQLRTVRVRVDGEADERGRARIADVVARTGVAAAPLVREEPSPAAVPGMPVPVPGIPVSTVSGPEPTATAQPVAVETAQPIAQPVAVEEDSPQVVEPDEDVVLVDAQPWPERASTSGEQARFSAAAGNAFTDGLSLVNSALATWPALRRSEAGSKADYVAVCLYLTRGSAGAVQVNRALRAGREVPIEGYLACLVSGFGRLPVHRRVVLRQSKGEQRWAVGSVLTDPGFVSAGVRHDVTVPGAEADLLIWPRSARRTSELGANRPIDEAVFLPGRQFKILAVRAAEGNEDSDGPSVPRTAVLLRELAPGESTVDHLDAAALAKLDLAWQRRRESTVRLVDDPEVVARLTMPMVVTS